jgi:hypothetical protein
MKALVCDVPACGGTRRRWQRICENCWRDLPGDIRTGILDAHRQHRRADHRRECRRAADHLAKLRSGVAQDVFTPPSRLTAEQAFQLTQRQLGER